jgi:DNA polymerase-1
MIRIHKDLADSDLDCDMLLQVHDELVFEVSERDAEAAAALIKRDMEGAMRLEVPLLVGIGRHFNWLEAHS